MAKVWEFIQPQQKELNDVTQRMGLLSMQSGSAPLDASHSTSEAIKLPDSWRIEALEKKSVAMENIVCVLNREVERASNATEEAMRQRRADQEKVDTLYAKVCHTSCLGWSFLFASHAFLKRLVHPDT